MLRVLSSVDPALQRALEIIDFNPADRVCGPGFPDHQDRILRKNIARKPVQHLLRRLSGNPLVDYRDGYARVPPIQDLLQAMRIGKLG